MGDFWSRVVDQSAGRLKVVLPLVGPRFAPLPTDALAASANVAGQTLPAEPLPGDPIEWPALVGPESSTVPVPTLRQLAQSGGEGQPLWPVIQESGSFQDVTDTSTKAAPDVPLDRQPAAEPRLARETTLSDTNETQETAGIPLADERAQLTTVPSTAAPGPSSSSAGDDRDVIQRHAASVETQPFPIAPLAAASVPRATPETGTGSSDLEPPLPAPDSTTAVVVDPASADAPNTAAPVHLAPDAVLNLAAVGTAPGQSPETEPPAEIWPLPAPIDATPAEPGPATGPVEWETAPPLSATDQPGKPASNLSDEITTPLSQPGRSTGPSGGPRTDLPQAPLTQTEMPGPIRPLNEAVQRPFDAAAGTTPEPAVASTNTLEPTTADPAVPQTVRPLVEPELDLVQAALTPDATTATGPETSPSQATATQSEKPQPIAPRSEPVYKPLSTAADAPDPAVASTNSPEPTEADSQPIRPDSEAVLKPLATPTDAPEPAVARTNPPEPFTADSPVSQPIAPRSEPALATASTQAALTPAASYIVEPVESPPQAAISQSEKPQPIKPGNEPVQRTDTTPPEPAVTRTDPPEPAATNPAVTQPVRPLVEPGPARAAPIASAPSEASPAGESASLLRKPLSATPSSQPGKTPPAVPPPATIKVRQIVAPPDEVQIAAPPVGTAGAETITRPGDAKGISPPPSQQPHPLRPKNGAGESEIAPADVPQLSQPAPIAKAGEPIDPPVQPLIAASSPAVPTPAPRPTIRVTIGQVEVRTKAEPAPLPIRRPAPPQPAVSLDDYLRGGQR